MSTARHRRRSWQQIGLETTVGVLVGSDAVLTVHAHNGLLRISTLALGVVSAALVLGTATWIVSVMWHNGRGRYLVHAIADAPLRRPLHPIADSRQNNTGSATSLADAIRADNWRNDVPGGLDAITGPRPYMVPLPDTAEEPVQ